jgi:phage shock protein E
MRGANVAGMNWRVVPILVGLVVFSFASAAFGQAAKPTAVEYLKQGAKVIDVRTVKEFQAGHLTNAINLPLAELEQKIGQQAPNKEQPLLVHCASGVRSAKAAKTLKKLGYSKVLDLGSYSQAADIVRESQK